MVADYIIDSKVSKAFYNYIKDEFKMDLGIYYTTRKLYTPYDVMAIKEESNLGGLNLRPEIIKKRVNNFVYINALKAFNAPNTFDDIISNFHSKDNGVIVVPSSVSRAIVAVTGVESVADYFIDNVIITVVPVDKTYLMIADYVSYTIL